MHNDIIRALQELYRVTGVTSEITTSLPPETFYLLAEAGVRQYQVYPSALPLRDIVIHSEAGTCRIIPAISPRNSSIIPSP